MSELKNEYEALDMKMIKNICSERLMLSNRFQSEKESFELVLPLFKDYLKIFMNSIGVPLAFTGGESLDGKEKYYSMCAMVNNLDDVLLIKVSENGNEYDINVRSMSKALPNSTVVMRFGRHTVDLEAQVLFRNTNNKTHCDTKDNPAIKTVTHFNGKRVLDEETDHKEEVKEDKGHSKKKKMGQ